MSIMQIWTNFHFLRPYWLLLLLPAITLVVLLYRREKNSNAWQQLLEPELLQPLLRGKVNAPGKFLPLMAGLGWLLGTLALSGPCWEKMPQAVEKRDHALVIVLDLSPSMLAQDIKPSRLVAAQHKILDLLRLRKEGYTALVAYSGDAHVVAPLTDDTQTIANLLKVLEPGIMPVYGSNVESALESAISLFGPGGYTQGDILLVTDGMTPEAISASRDVLAGKPFILSVIGVGTEAGAPIPAAGGGFVKDHDGNIVLPQLHASDLAGFAHAVNGYYNTLQLGDTDIQALVDGRQAISSTSTRKSDREFDLWRDRGAYLALLLLPLVLATFRRGILICWLMLSFTLIAPHSQADENASENHTPQQSHQDNWFDRLWLNENQRAKKALQKEDYDTATQLFNDADWKAAAGHGLGNALARSGKLQEAISAYDKVLHDKPDRADTLYNKKLVEDLLKKQNSKQESPQNQPSDNKQPDQSGQKPEQQPDSQKNQPQHPQEGQKEAPQNSGSEATQGDSGQKQPADKGREEKAHEARTDDKAATDAQRETSPAGQTKPENAKQSTRKTGMDSKPLTPEQQQALEQALRGVPDDPSGLLRNKFEYYYQQRLQANSTNRQLLNQEERW